MPESPKSTPASRQQLILQQVARGGSARVEELAAKLGVSEMTVYRDIAELEKSGLVQLDRKEITAVESSLLEASARLRIATNAPVKSKFARISRKFLRSGMSLALDDSSTNLPLVENLESLAPLTVITNAEFLAQRVREQKGVRLILLGGTYETWADAYFGDLTELAVSQLNIDVCIMSATAISHGYCFPPDQQVAKFKLALQAASRRRILVADATKFRR
uniref:DeoR/GlpR family DNA-binding transcription regulator n=1 Tax=uncultured Varibaculum sp. TaxID=413896 RepID=UPI00288B0682